MALPRIHTGKKRRSALAAARTSFRGTPARARGKGLQISLESSLSAGQINLASTDRKVRVLINKVMRKAGARMVARAKKLSKPTWDTGAFASGWGSRLINSQGDLRVVVELFNSVPYSGYVARSQGGDAKAYRRGDKSRTVINKYIKPMVSEVAEEIDEDLQTIAPQIEAAIAEGILSRRSA